jgi:hypothetical protein
MLASTVAALDTGLNPSELKANLEAVKKHYANVRALASGEPLPFPSKGEPTAAPAPQKSQFIEGQIYQDQHGNKAKYANGQWVPQ